MAHPPTPEQTSIIQAFQTGGDLVIEARAGTGKTTTLKMLGQVAQASERKGIYLAYNRAIADEARASFPSNVKCATAHSFAWHAMVKPSKTLQRRMNSPRMKMWEQSKVMGVRRAFQLNSEVTYSPSQQAALASQTVQRFCNSADREVSFRHVPWIEGIEGADRNNLQRQITPIAKRAWEDITSEHGSLPFRHDYYLKMWQLTNPTLRADFVLFDEAQDANPVIADIVGKQDMQKIMVGDGAQAIYGWRGAVDAMASFDCAHRLALSQSFRFGDLIAAEANKWLGIVDPTGVKVRGFDQIPSIVQLGAADPDAILCRTNATAIGQAMMEQAKGRRVSIVGGTDEIQTLCNVAESLMQNTQPWQAEYAAFDNWSDFCQYAEDEGDGNLRVFIRLVEEYGIDSIMRVAKANIKDEAKADVTISTAHKAKGREWDTVRIAPDFQEPDKDKGEEIRRDEAMLAYVAVTRAKKVLDNTGLAWINSWIAAPALAG